MHVPRSYLRQKWVDTLYWAETVLTKAFGAEVTKAESADSRSPGCQCNVNPGVGDTHHVDLDLQHT